jgi:hypothetical protein
MTAAVQFDNQPLRAAAEVHNELPNWELASELVTEEPSIAEIAPEQTFCRSGIVAESLCELSICRHAGSLTEVG